MASLVGREVHLVLDGLMPSTVVSLFVGNSAGVRVILAMTLGVVPLNAIVNTHALVKSSA